MMISKKNERCTCDFIFINIFNHSNFHWTKWLETKMHQSSNLEYGVEKARKTSLLGENGNSNWKTALLFLVPPKTWNFLSEEMNKTEIDLRAVSWWFWLWRSLEDEERFSFSLKHGRSSISYVSPLMSVFFFLKWH